jgi:hypothetical protein
MPSAERQPVLSSVPHILNVCVASNAFKDVAAPGQTVDS